MGADFIFAVTKMVKDPEALKAKIPTLSNEVLDDVWDRHYGEEVPDYKAVRDLIATAIDYVVGESREMGWFECFTCKTQYVISGGMTWGDDPTEACEYIWTVEGSGLEE
jgi:hypothetical protein